MAEGIGLAAPGLGPEGDASGEELDLIDGGLGDQSSGVMLCVIEHHLKSISAAAKVS